MYTGVLWASKEYQSTENCIISVSDKGVETHSVIVGASGNLPFCAEYLIKTNADWETCYCQLSLQINGNTKTVLVQKEKDGWLQDGKLVSAFDGCMDVDIPITPFTNTLPVNRCKMAINESCPIKVVYFDILNGSVRALQQKYTRVSDRRFRYENVPNDFEATITVDNAGLVIEYPGLFERVAVSQWF
ncbi:MAG: hypothetical protein K0R82_1411 [Flavipsychrobacter sp.]|jgi:hypothetical protein|nr:hypothetical protein [Flavipsychrobacter sp.]